MQRPKSETALPNPVLTTEALSRALIANLPGGAAFVVDRDLRYLLAEGEALATAGFKPEDLVGQTIFEALPPDLAAKYEPMYRQALAGEPFEHEHNAHNHTYISRGTPLRDGNDEIYAVLVVSYDISERKRIEDDRKQVEATIAADLQDTQLLHNLATRLTTEGDIETLYQEILAAAIALTRADAGSIQILDKATQELVLITTQGSTPEMIEHFHRVNAGSNTSCGQALLTGDRTFVDFTVPEREDPDGSIRMHREAGYLSAQSTPLIARSGKPIGMVSTHWCNLYRPSDHQLRFLDLLARQAADLIEQRQAEATLRESEAKYRSLFDTMGQGYCELELIRDSEGRVVDQLYLELNPAFERLIGIPVAKAKGRKASEVLPQLEPIWHAAFDRIARSGVPDRIEYEVASLGRWFEVFAYPGGGDRLTVLYVDITDRKCIENERKRAEESLRESEARQAFLLQMSDALRSLADPVEIQETVTRTAMSHFGADRCYYCEIEDGNAIIRRDAAREDLPSIAGVYPLSSFAILQSVIEAGRPFVVQDVYTTDTVDEDLRQLCIQLQVISFIDVPVIKDGKPVGVLCLVQSTPRNWSDLEVELTVETADRTWSAVERAKTEQSLRTSEAKYRSLFTSIDEGFNLLEMISDKSGHPADFRIVETNPAWEQQTGLTNAIGKTLLEIAPNFEQQLLDLYGDVVCSGKGRRTEYYTAAVDRWYTVYASRIGGEGSRQVAVVFNDITDRKRSEAQLRRAAERDAFRLKLSDALRSLTDPVQIQAEACRLLGEQLGADRAYYVEVHEPEGYARVNQHYSRGDSPAIVGNYRLSEYGWSLPLMRRGETIVITDTQSTDIIPDVERAAMARIGMIGFVAIPLIKGEVLVGSLAVNEPTPREWTEAEVDLVRETAERIWADIQRAHAETALRESELQRIREQSAREEERQRAESLAELDRAKTLFFSNISHEFRTPLTLLLSPLQDVLGDHALPPLHRERLELAQRNSLRLLKLVNTLLDFSRIEAGRMEAMYEPTDLSQFTADLASVFRSAIEQAGLRFTVDCLPLPEAVYVDREMWEKIVLNLISNAFKFTLTGEITVRLHPVNHHVILEIEDTGSGIEPEELPHVFERFHQVRGVQARSQEGSGIGLALVHELVQLQGGTIHVSSTLGQGSCFTISLPFGSEHLPPDRIKASQFLPSITTGATPHVQEAELWRPLRYRRSSAHPQPLPDSSNARVLLVDDNADMRDYLTRILSESVQVEAVADGVSALAAIQRQLPDLVLTDVMMPGLDGFGLLQTLRANPQTREIPILLLSARAGEEAIVEGLEAGADDYLIKPFSAQELISRVNAHLQIAQLRTTALREARSTIQSRDELLSTVSHELNTPLVSILGWTRLLRSTPPSPAILTKALDTIERNATVQAALVQDLLDISRITVGKLRLNPQPVELTSILETAIATVVQTAEAKTIDLVWQSQPDYDVQVMGDLDRLQQVFCNLLTNAIKFTPEGGSVTVELSTLLDQAEIRVRDTGIGIAADFLPHVFDRFRQARPSDATKGLGVGLAIAHHIVNLHGGTIQAESAGEEQGATFIIHLPLLASMTDEQLTQSEV